MNKDQAIAVFGSALTSASPGDIDVAYTGEWTAQTEAVVRAWAMERGLSADLPVDAHRTTLSSALVPVDLGAKTHPTYWVDDAARKVVHLPAPWGIKGQALVLRGDVQIEWQEIRTIPALIRAFGHDGARFVIEWEAMHPCARELFIHARSPWGTEDWATYTSGISALLSAITKAPAWGEIVSCLGDTGKFIDAMAHHGPTSEAARYARDRSSGGASRIMLGDGDVYFQYGGERYTYAEAMAEFVFPGDTRSF